MGEEGVDGSSPSEGSKRPANGTWLALCAELQLRRWVVLRNSQTLSLQGFALPEVLSISCSPRWRGRTQVARRRASCAEERAVMSPASDFGCSSAAKWPPWAPPPSSAERCRALGELSRRCRQILRKDGDAAGHGDHRPQLRLGTVLEQTQKGGNERNELIAVTRS